MKGIVNSKISGFIFVILGAVCIATLGIFAKFGYAHGGTPLSLLFIRFIAGAIMFWASSILFKYKIEKIAGKDLLILFSGSLSIVLSAIAYFYALKYITVPLAISIIYLFPSIVTILTLFIFKESIGRIKVIALILSFSGCILLIELFNFQAFSYNFLGILLSAACAFFVAIYIIILQYIVSRQRIFNTALYFVTFSAIIITLIMLPNFKSVLSINRDVWIIGTLMAFFTIFLTRILMLYGIKQIGASRMSIISSSELVFASFFAYILLNEGFNFIQGMGAFLILTGVALINFDRSKTL